MQVDFLPKRMPFRVQGAFVGYLSRGLAGSASDPVADATQVKASLNLGHIASYLHGAFTEFIGIYIAANWIAYFLCDDIDTSDFNML